MHVHVVGANGCGNVAISDGLKDFPLACWQDFPFGDSEEARAQAQIQFRASLSGSVRVSFPSIYPQKHLRTIKKTS